MRNTVLLILCVLIAMVFCGCMVASAEPNHTLTPKPTDPPIKTINVDYPKDVVVTVLTAEPSYVRNDITFLRIDYRLQNNTDDILRGSKYKMVFRGYTSDSKLIFEKDRPLLSLNDLDAGTYTEESYSVGMIDGVEIIDKLQISIEQNY